jgi:hypothetical protein
MKSTIPNMHNSKFVSKKHDPYLFKASEQLSLPHYTQLQDDDGPWRVYEYRFPENTGFFVYVGSGGWTTAQLFLHDDEGNITHTRHSATVFFEQQHIRRYMSDLVSPKASKIMWAKRAKESLIKIDQLNGVR